MIHPTYARSVRGLKCRARMRPFTCASSRGFSVGISAGGTCYRCTSSQPDASARRNHHHNIANASFLPHDRQSSDVKCVSQTSPASPPLHHGNIPEFQGCLGHRRSPAGSALATRGRRSQNVNGPGIAPGAPHMSSRHDGLILAAGRHGHILKGGLPGQGLASHLTGGTARALNLPLRLPCPRAG